MNIPLRFGHTVFTWQGIEKPDSAAIQRATLPEVQFLQGRYVDAVYDVGRDSLTLTINAPAGKKEDEETAVKSIIYSIADLREPTLSHTDLESPDAQAGMTRQKNVGAHPKNKFIWSDSEDKYLLNPDYVPEKGERLK